MRLTLVLILLSVGLAISREINTDTAKDGKQSMEDRIEALERGFNSDIEALKVEHNSRIEALEKVFLPYLSKNSIKKEEPRSPPQTNAMIASVDQPEPPQDCAEILSRDPSATNGIYEINVGSKRVQRLTDVLCDMETDGGGWTVFQRRLDGNLNFYRDYQTYADGFGLLLHEFWLGNENIHQITSRMNYELRVELEEFSGETAHAQYTSFLVKSACDGYELFVTGYSGNAGESLENHSGMKFSTFDRDQDSSTSRKCAEECHGAWWYNNCAHSNLNGLYVIGGSGSMRNVGWYYSRNTWSLSMKATEMKVRPSLLTCPI